MTDTAGTQRVRFQLHRDVTPEERAYVCRHLVDYNVTHTDGLLREPGVDVDLVLRDGDGQVMGGIFCDTFLRCLYIDVLWIDEAIRGQGYGRALIREAEAIARTAGCTFAHTCTFSYQAPDFYQREGYEIFGVIDAYPDGIKQYFLIKKAL